MRKAKPTLQPSRYYAIPRRARNYKQDYISCYRNSQIKPYYLVTVGTHQMFTRNLVIKIYICVRVEPAVCSETG